MRRARWIAWEVLAALSLLLCLAALGLWLRSYRVRDTIGFGWRGGNCHVTQSILGRLHLLTTLGGGCAGGASYAADRMPPRAIWHGGMSGYPPRVRWRLGFVWQTYEQGDFGGGRPFSTSRRLIVVPYWFPVGVFALAPLAWAAGVRRRVELLDLVILEDEATVVLALRAFPAASTNQRGVRNV